MINVGRKMLLSMAVIMLFWTSQASAATIDGFFNTGVDASGYALTNGVTDSHYTIDAASAPYSPYVVNGFYPIAPDGPWVANSAKSMWISPTLNTEAGAEYVYTTTFSVTGSDAGTALLSIKIAADDDVRVSLNGNLVTTVNGAFSDWHYLTISGFTAGTNTLTFDVINSGGGPTGLRVEAVPLPPAAALLAPGLFMLAAMRRRFRK